MSKGLFSNVGKSMKRLATVIFWLLLITYILLALVMVIVGIAGAAEMGNAGIAVGCIIGAALVLGFGIFVARIAVMQLYAFGEITERVQSLDSKMDTLVYALYPQNGYAAAPAANNAWQAPKATWACPYCGNENSAESAFCTNCGNKKL